MSRERGGGGLARPSFDDYSARLGTDHATVPAAKEYPRDEKRTVVAGGLYYQFQSRLNKQLAKNQAEVDFAVIMTTSCRMGPIALPGAQRRRRATLG